MTLTFFSNFLNIHQLPFCLEMIKHLGEENFRFVATAKMTQDRLEMGFEDMNNTKPFVIRAYEGGVEYNEAKRLAVESDVAIMGSAPLEYTELRMKTNRLTFQYTERLLRLGWRVFLMPGFYRSTYRQFFRYRKRNQYILCASAFTAPDLEKLGWPRAKCFKWGYFPDVSENVSLSNNKVIRHSDGFSIIWVGRLISLKHPESTITLGKELKAHGYDFTIKILGDGEERKNLQAKIEENNLSENVLLLGSLSHEEVLTEMRKSDIYLFTSDKREGWGAVLNEAMSAGCAVVASDAIGSTPFLIKDGENGYMYRDGDMDDLLQKVCSLIDNPLKRNQFSVEAIKTIGEEWSIENATNNLIKLIHGLQKDGKTPIETGPCSLA